MIGIRSFVKNVIPIDNTTDASYYNYKLWTKYCWLLDLNTVEQNS